MEEQFRNCSFRLKTCREENNYTLEDIAKKLNVNRSTVLRWENGEVEKIKSPFLKELSDLYGVNIVWLMGYETSKYTYLNTSSNNIISLDGLTEKDIEYIKQQIEFLKWKNKSNISENNL